MNRRHIVLGYGFLGERVGVVLLGQLVQFQHIQMQLVEAIVIVLDELLQFPGCKLTISRKDHLSHWEVLVILVVLVSYQLVCLVEVNAQISQESCAVIAGHSRHIVVVMYPGVRECIVSLSIASRHFHLSDASCIRSVTHVSSVDFVQERVSWVLSTRVELLNLLWIIVLLQDGSFLLWKVREELLQHFFRFLEDHKLEWSETIRIFSPWLIQREDFLSVFFALAKQSKVVSVDGSDHISCVVAMASPIVRLVRSPKLLNFILYDHCVWVEFAEFEDWWLGRNLLCSGL